jgi:hypothetical protein
LIVLVGAGTGVVQRLLGRLPEGLLVVDIVVETLLELWLVAAELAEDERL